MVYSCPHCKAELKELIISDPSEGEITTCHAQETGDLVLIDREELERYIAGWLAHRELKRRIEAITPLLVMLAYGVGGFWVGGDVDGIKRVLSAEYDFEEESKRIVNSMLKGGSDGVVRL